MVHDGPLDWVVCVTPDPPPTSRGTSGPSNNPPVSKPPTPDPNPLSPSLGSRQVRAEHPPVTLEVPTQHLSPPPSPGSGTGVIPYFTVSTPEDRVGGGTSGTRGLGVSGTRTTVRSAGTSADRRSPGGRGDGTGRNRDDGFRRSTPASFPSSTVPHPSDPISVLSRPGTH